MNDGPDVREVADIPAVEVIRRASLMLMSAAAENSAYRRGTPPTAFGADP